MLLVIIVNTLVVITVVMIHYECLSRLDDILPKFKSRPKIRIALGVLIALTAHAIEIWVFAFAYYFENYYTNYAKLLGNFDGGLLDCVYFSFTTYTTLGFGDIYPVGDVRYLVGIESLTGLVLVAWTASYLYVEMVNNWKIKRWG